MRRPEPVEGTGFGIYHYGARFYSPKLGRFLSADSLVPNTANPQDFNRYSYVRNNPVRYTDPTGHMCSDPEDPNPTCEGSSVVKTRVGNKMVSGSGRGGFGGVTTPVKPKTGGAGAGGYTPTPTGAPTATPTTPPASTPSVTPTVTPIEAYCGDTSTLGCLSMVTQDATTLIDLVGVGLIEAPLVALGCLDAGWPGCVAGELVAAGVWSSTLGNLDIGLSWLSTGFTIADDLVNNGGIGENTITSVSASIAGMMAPTPSTDLIIDGYAAGYNHGIFNGVSAIFNGSSIFSWVK